MTPKSTPKPKTPLERMTDLTQRLIAVPKSEVLKRQKRKKKK
jgi:hypothetical protein